MSAISSLYRRTAFLALALLLTGPAGCVRPGGAKAPPFSPRIGVCTSIANAAAVKNAGGDYIEESVQGFLVPDKPDADFRPKAAAVEVDGNQNPDKPGCDHDRL